MKFNNLVTGFVIGITIFGLVGCNALLKKNNGVFGKASKEITELKQDISDNDKAKAQKNEERLTKIGAFAKGGVEHALNQIPSTNVTPAVTVAKKMNERVEALANKPDFKEVEAIKNIVDELLSQIDKTRQAGEDALAKKDKEIQKLNDSIIELNQQHESQVEEVLNQATVNAAERDQYKATLGQMDKWFGLGAVFYGGKKFLISSMWILGIGSVIFLILRVASMSNPIAASIFSIFNTIGSWVVHAIQLIVPKAVDMAGHVASTTFNAYKSTLTKLVDAIQMAKTDADKNGKTVDIKTVLDDVAKSMNADEKAIVDQIKTALNWK